MSSEDKMNIISHMNVKDQNSNHQTGKTKTDFDSAWKEVIEKLFESFTEFFFPEIHRDIDFSKGIEFLDSELREITPYGNVGKRYADELVKVHLKDGECILFFTFRYFFLTASFLFQNPSSKYWKALLPFPFASLRRYLMYRRFLPQKVVDYLIAGNILYADDKANAVFLLLGKGKRVVGAEIRGTNDHFQILTGSNISSTRAWKYFVPLIRTKQANAWPGGCVDFTRC